MSQTGSASDGLLKPPVHTSNRGPLVVIEKSDSVEKPDDAYNGQNQGGP